MRGHQQHLQGARDGGCQVPLPCFSAGTRWRPGSDRTPGSGTAPGKVGTVSQRPSACLWSRPGSGEIEAQEAVKILSLVAL